MIGKSDEPHVVVLFHCLAAAMAILSQVLGFDQCGKDLAESSIGITGAAVENRFLQLWYRVKSPNT